MSVATPGDTDPIDATVVTMDLEVETYIARADGLTLDKEVNIDGSATFEIIY
ncbi:hypothetical protein D3C84_1100940 [compost metagenome]